MLRSLFLVLTLPLAADACSVPVFRYALEQWQASKYEMYLFHGGRLTQVEEQGWYNLQRRAKWSNVSFTRVDLGANVSPEEKAIWEAEPADGILPRLVLRYPGSGPKIRSVWSGPMSDALTLPLFESPARQELFNRLTFGNAGAVVLLLSGDKAKDDAARTMLEKELPRIAKSIDLPARTEEGPQVQSPVPLKVHFPLLEVARNKDEAEFVRILLGSEDGLDKVQGPIAFPVFGRGRALCSLHGQDLVKPGELQRSLEFLCKACSCQVKELNPGPDLLIRGNWDVVLNAQTGPAPRTAFETGEPRPSSSPDSERAESRLPPPRVFEAAETESESNPPAKIQWRRVVMIGALVGFLLSGYWAWQSRRKPPAGSA